MVSDATSPAIAFARPAGVYLLDSSQVEHRTKAFLTGETLAVSWAQVESADGSPYCWDTLNGAISATDPSQDITLNIQEEACYIADSMNTNREYPTWCDGGGAQPLHLVTCNGNSCPGGTARAVPWDSYLQGRRDAFYEALKTNLNLTGAMSRISTINPNLPGADTGIRNVSVPFNNMSMPGYTRERLLATIQDELRTLQDKFPGKLIQIGFFTAKDSQNGSYGNSPLWKWLYRDASNYTDANGVHLVALGDEFNGIKRPRVSFFQENLAATRTLTPSMLESSSAPNYITPALTTAYTSTPISASVPAFAYYSAPTNDQYRNGTTFQSNTPWSDPFFSPNDGIKLIRTINGSPNDGMEAAFNTYLSQYLEVYPGDVDEAQPQSGPPTLNAELWAGQLKSWHDYFQTRRDLAPIEGPAGLTVERTGSTNVVSWFPVYGATSYYLESKPDFFLAGWGLVDGCVPASTTCTETFNDSLNFPLAYRVQATNGTQTSQWSNVEIFFSASSYDGYVESTGTTQTPQANAAQPGILAGEGAGGAGQHWKGFLSFNIGYFLEDETFLDAKLRLKQATAGNNFPPSAARAWSIFETAALTIMRRLRGPTTTRLRRLRMRFAFSASAKTIGSRPS